MSGSSGVPAGPAVGMGLTQTHVVSWLHFSYTAQPHRVYKVAYYVMCVSVYACMNMHVQACCHVLSTVHAHSCVKT